MHLRNRDGTAVDPVPFLVVAVIVVATCYSFGPLYFAALGLSMPLAIAVTTVICLGGVAASYYRLVWRYFPRRREILPASARLSRLVLAAIVCLAAVALLAVPLFAR